MTLKEKIESTLLRMAAAEHEFEAAKSEWEALYAAVAEGMRHHTEQHAHKRVRRSSVDMAKVVERVADLMTAAGSLRVAQVVNKLGIPRRLAMSALVSLHEVDKVERAGRGLWRVKAQSQPA